MKMNYSYNEMKRAFECGRNFQLTGENNFQELIEEMNQALPQAAVSGSAFWNDDKVIDFVNWYIELHKLDFRYTLENRIIIESFKNGDDTSKWHCH